MPPVAEENVDGEPQPPNRGDQNDQPFTNQVAIRGEGKVNPGCDHKAGSPKDIYDAGILQT